MAPQPLVSRTRVCSKPEGRHGQREAFCRRLCFSNPRVWLAQKQEWPTFLTVASTPGLPFCFSQIACDDLQSAAACQRRRRQGSRHPRVCTGGASNGGPWGSPGLLLVRSPWRYTCSKRTSRRPSSQTKRQGPGGSPSPSGGALGPRTCHNSACSPVTVCASWGHCKDQVTDAGAQG